MSPEIAVLVPGQNTRIGTEWAAFPPMKHVMASYDRVAGTHVGPLLETSPEARTVDVESAHRLLTLLVLSVREYASVPAHLAGGHSLGAPLSLVFIDGYQDTGLPKESVVRLTEWRAQVQKDAQAIDPGEMYPFLWKGVNGFDEVDALISTRSDMWAACYNVETDKSAQVIVAVRKGWDKEAFERSLSDHEKAGLRVLNKLAIDLGAHSPLVKDAAQKLGQYTRALAASGEIRMPRHGTLFVADHTRDGKIHATNNPHEIARLLGDVDEPVRFQSMIEEMYALGARHFIEIGSTTLSDMIKRMGLVDVITTPIVTPDDVIRNFAPKPM